jgi:lysozyme family protein
VSTVRDDGEVRRAPAAMTSPAAFGRALAFVLRWEGGEVHDPADPGGHTKYGISKRAHPEVDIATLTVGQAAEIYRTKYWALAGCADLPWPVALGVFDMAVNAGVRTAVRCLQRAVGAVDDGVLGPATLKAVDGRDPVRVARDLAVYRMRHYAALEGWGRFGLAWTKRTIDAVVVGVTQNS